MGLDMYAYATEEATSAEDVLKLDLENHEEFFYWRKHPNLHGWMEALYRSKGGTAESFNCVPVRLDPADLDTLEAAVKNDALPVTEGFFFGVSDGSEKADDLEFIRKAREAIADGDTIFYSSWW
jgi:hypothetical protein